MIISTLAPNQILLTEDNGDRHFKSYTTNIASIVNGRISVNENYWNSGQTATTNRYLGDFLKIGQSGVKKYVNSAIESGLITLTKDIKRF